MRILSFLFPALAALLMLLSGIKVIPTNGIVFLSELILLLLGIISHLLKGDK